MEDIIFIGAQPVGKLIGESIHVLSKDKRIAVTALRLEHWELISRLIKALPDLNKVEIDSYVRSRVNQ